MSTDRDTTRIVRSWLRTDEHESADRVLDAVIDQIDTTPQRRATWWPVRRFPEMNNTAKLALAAAAVVVAAFLGIRFLAPGTGVGGPGPTPTPTPEPRALFEGSQGPGSFTTEFFSETPVANPVQFTFEMPADWGAARPWVIGPSAEGQGAAVTFIQPRGLYSDPCLANAGDPDVSVGSTADEFASALDAHEAYDATVTGEATIDGYYVVRMELQAPSDLDYGTCQGGQFWVWAEPFLMEAPSRWDLWIFDLDGTVAVVLAEGALTAQHKDQVQQIVDSIQIEP